MEVQLSIESADFSGITQHIQRHETLVRVIRSKDLTYHEFRVLCQFVATGRVLTSRQINEGLTMTRPQLLDILHRLVRAGWVKELGRVDTLTTASVFELCASPAQMDALLRTVSKAITAEEASAPGVLGR